MGSPPAAAGGGLARADPLHSFGNDQLTFVEAAGHDRPLRRRLAEMDAPYLRPVLPVDDVDVVPLLVGQDRRARDAKHRDRLHPFQQYSDKFLIRELADRRRPVLC